MPFVYIVECRDGTLYTGSTTDLDRRIKEHNTGAIGAKYTKARRPVVLRYSESADSKGDALRREAAIKKLSRVQKVALFA